MTHSDREQRLSAQQRFIRAVERGLTVTVPAVFAWSDGGDPAVYHGNAARSASGRMLLRHMNVETPEDATEQYAAETAALIAYSLACEEGHGDDLLRRARELYGTVRGWSIVSDGHGITGTPPSKAKSNATRPSTRKHETPERDLTDDEYLALIAVGDMWIRDAELKGITSAREHPNDLQGDTPKERNADRQRRRRGRTALLKLQQEDRMADIVIEYRRRINEIASLRGELDDLKRRVAEAFPAVADQALAYLDARAAEEAAHTEIADLIGDEQDVRTPHREAKTAMEVAWAKRTIPGAEIPGA
jgi:hypothetical protein